jgi:hypothetical protein
MMRKANRKTRESLWFDIGWFTAEAEDAEGRLKNNLCELCGESGFYSEEAATSQECV